MEAESPASDSTTNKALTEKRYEEGIKTPVRPGKGSKRKHPDTGSTPSRAEEAGSSAKKRRRSSTGGGALSRVGSPATTLLKPPLTERQQMALLLQLTDPTKQTSPGSPVVGGGTPETTPRRLLRKNERGETPLHLAAIKGDLKTVSSLLGQGADVMATDHAGWTPLHEACNHGHSAVARELLSHGAQVGVAGMDGDTPLHDAVGNGHLETVQVLLECGANPLCVNEQGRTPIDICTHAAILKLLKSHDQGSSVLTNETEEQPCPKRRRSSSSTVDGDDLADKEEYSAVFSPEATPTLQPVTTPTLPVKKTQLRGVSFSDISSSESDIEAIESNKDCEKDGPKSQVDVAPVKEAVNDEERNDKDIENDQKSPSSEETVEEPSMQSPVSPPPVKEVEATPINTPTDDTPALEDPPIEAAGQDSRPSPQEDENTMLLSIPLSVVRVSSKSQSSSENSKGSLSSGPNETQDEEPTSSGSFNISLDWKDIKSPPSTLTSLHVTHGPIRSQSEDDSSSLVTSPDPSRSIDNTVISFKKSFPLVFSCHPPPSSKPHSCPPSPERLRHTATPPLSEVEFKRSSSQDSVVMPPKMRHRPVMRSVMKSAVIQQQSNTPQTNDFSDLPLFTISHDLRSHEPITPVSPKTVYPPLPASLYQQFSEQEAERIKLATTHRVEQERLRLSLTQELCRAQQRAKKGPTPLSACALLLEKLLPPATPTQQSDNIKSEPGQSILATPTREEELDVRLLSGLVQDVWDKFRQLKVSLVNRQRQEAEALWLLQREQWRSVGGDFPSTHVPLIIPGNLTRH